MQLLLTAYIVILIIEDGSGAGFCLGELVVHVLLKMLQGSSMRGHWCSRLPVQSLVWESFSLWFPDRFAICTEASLAVCPQSHTQGAWAQAFYGLQMLAANVKPTVQMWKVDHQVQWVFVKSGQVCNWILYWKGAVGCLGRIFKGRKWDLLVGRQCRRRKERTEQTVSRDMNISLCPSLGVEQSSAMSSRKKRAKGQNTQRLGGGVSSIFELKTVHPEKCLLLLRLTSLMPSCFIFFITFTAIWNNPL